LTAAPSAERRLIFGTDEAVGDSVALRAGPLDLTLAGGKLRHIRLGDLEVWDESA
jgi:hypothetical protein